MYLISGCFPSRIFKFYKSIVWFGLRGVRKRLPSGCLPFLLWTLGLHARLVHAKLWKNELTVRSHWEAETETNEMGPVPNDIGSGISLILSLSAVWISPHNSIQAIFTARNEVGASLYFYTCLWFCSQGEVLPHCMLGYTPRDQRQAPPSPGQRQALPLGPEAGTLPPGTRGRHPSPHPLHFPSAVHADRYGQQAGVSVSVNTPLWLIFMRKIREIYCSGFFSGWHHPGILIAA